MQHSNLRGLLRNSSEYARYPSMICGQEQMERMCKRWEVWESTHLKVAQGYGKIKNKEWGEVDEAEQVVRGKFTNHLIRKAKKRLE